VAAWHGNVIALVHGLTVMTRNAKDFKNDLTWTRQPLQGE
jgi:hypothetical protein